MKMPRMLTPGSLLRRRPLVVALAGLLAFATAGAASAAVINVPADQPTIQAGINAASTGDVVIVASGVYVENLVLQKNITLQGAQAGVPACNRVATETIVQPAAGGSPVLLINAAGAANATVDGFTFDSNGNTPANGCVDIESSVVPGLRILNNRIRGFKSSGLWYNRGSVDGVISGNEINGATMVGAGQLLFMNGPQTFNGIQITNNCFLNSSNYGWFVDGNRNIGVGTNPATISGNLFKNNGTGANTGSRSLLSANITNNVFDSNVGTGWQGGPKLCNITGNQFKNNGASGLAFTSFGSTDPTKGAQSNVVSGNTFMGNVSEGLFLSSGQAAGTISTNSIHNNDFLGTTTGVRYGGAETIDVSCNWWNDINGPNYPPTNNNAAGAGLVGASMTFSPWLNGSIAGAPLCNQTQDRVQAVTAGLCISTAHPCVNVPVNFTRVNTTGARGISVTFTINLAKIQLCGTPAASIHQGTWLNAYSTTFQVLDNGGGSYTVDQAILGLPCGQTAGGQLFTVDLAASDGDGTGTITITDVQARDCSNAPIPGGPGSPANIPVDQTAPTTIADLAASQVKAGNDADGTTKIKLTFTAPGDAATVEVYRAGFGNYPEYDDAPGAGSVPATPAYPPPAPWALTGVTATNQTDEVANRDFWYYVVFTKDACGNVSSVSNKTTGTLNYHLGDVSDGVTACQGNNQVTTADISLLGAHYGAVLADPDAFGCLDVGPTTDNSVNGRPTTDNRVQFEDLILFAINYGQVSAPQMSAGAVASDRDEIGIDAPATVAAGQTFTATVQFKGAGDIQGLSAKLGWDRSVVEPVSVQAGELMTRQNGVVLSSEPGDVDAALLGVRELGMAGEGALATVTFRALATGSPKIALASADARDAANRRVLFGASKPAAPTVTELQPVAPNPFRQSATLTFSLAKAGPVDLAIYSVDGRRVRTLLKDSRDAGSYRLVWNGIDDRGSAVHAGVYYARLATAAGTFKRTVVYMK
jgi:hypothetical protein